MASENLGENGRVGRRLGVILLYKLVIGMLRTNAEFIEMLTGFAFWQDLKTPCTKLHHARVAAQMVVLSLPQNGCPAPRTLPTLLSELLWVNKLGQKACLVSPCLSLVHLMDPLVPSPDLIIIEQPAFAGGKMIVARDQLPTSPAEVNLAIPTQDFAAAL